MVCNEKNINAMKKEQVTELFQRFEAACYVYENVECWSARELQSVLGYAEWRNFLKITEKAKESCRGAGEKISDHFVEINKMVELGSGAHRQIDDLAITRYACYLIAQNGDPSKPEIAFAQTYFAVQTRKQELIEQRLLDVNRLAAREKLSKSEKKLSGIIYERDVDEKGFALIRSDGDKALFGGFNTKEMKKKLAIPENRPLADFLPTLTIKAKDFAAELTSHNIVERDLKGNRQISEEHVVNNKEVRKILLKRGVKPEHLPPAEDIKKLVRRLDSENNKAQTVSKNHSKKNSNKN